MNNVVANRSAKVQAAKQRLKLAKAMEKKLALETLGGQYTASLNTANAQIAGSC